MTEATFQIIQKIYELTLILIQLGIIVSLFFIFVPNEGITIRKRNLFIATISVERLLICFVTAETKGVFLVISAVTVLLFFIREIGKCCHCWYFFISYGIVFLVFALFLQGFYLIVFLIFF
ncbi:hypothetical protein CIY_05190 [Butyrivibrio fibrisolvens 16/4]|nr:hypothetical protein CIY_05190 [Butyrivibrio fibrisolvens 16/4]